MSLFSCHDLANVRHTLMSRHINFDSNELNQTAAKAPSMRDVNHVVHDMYLTWHSCSAYAHVTPYRFRYICPVSKTVGSSSRQCHVIHAVHDTQVTIFMLISVIYVHRTITSRNTKFGTCQASETAVSAKKIARTAATRANQFQHIGCSSLTVAIGHFVAASNFPKNTVFLAMSNSL